YERLNQGKAPYSTAEYLLGKFGDSFAIGILSWIALIVVTSVFAGFSLAVVAINLLVAAVISTVTKILSQQRLAQSLKV
ncbi:hypothetical protein NL474_30295, partial [Klebsiella pneumoniae]|nr:hypothetical protein [Klebsiella pneumoniae]